MCLMWSIFDSAEQYSTFLSQKGVVLSAGNTVQIEKRLAVHQPPGPIQQVSYLMAKHAVKTDFVKSWDECTIWVVGGGKLEADQAGFETRLFTFLKPKLSQSWRPLKG
jgi:hypothetical protein